MARVLIKRGADTAGIFSRIEVNIDGVRVAALLPLQSQEAELEPGSHEVIANMSWARSRPLEISVAQNDTVRLRVKTSWRPIGRALKNLDDVRGVDMNDSVLIEQF